MEDLLGKAMELLRHFPLCDACLGRQFAMLGYGLSNAERGRGLKTALFLLLDQKLKSGSKEALNDMRLLAENGFFEPARQLLAKIGVEIPESPEGCFLCRGIMERVDELAGKALEALSGYEFSTFLVGIRLPAEMEEREDQLRAQYGLEHSEGLRNELSREVGKRIARATGKQVKYRKPDITIIVEPFTGLIELRVSPVFIAGRYRKLVRGIPQAKWVCTRCGGRGCPRCNWQGKLYPTSVSELITEPIVEAFGGEGAAFHAAGREDVDARMLGRGRPFVVEVKRPRKREVDLKALEALVNERARGMVSVSGLKYVDRAFIRRMKAREAEKVYEVLVEFDRAVSDGELKALEEALSGALIRQRTPTRVLHRRADKLRLKKVRELRAIERLGPCVVRFRITCDGGLYVKELVTGDGGRTTPSISELIRAHARPLELDVVDVLMEGV